MVNGKVFTAWAQTPDADDPSIIHYQQPFKVCSCKDAHTCGAGAVCNLGIATRDPDQPTVEVDRYCAVGSDDLCGPGGSLEFWGEAQWDQQYNAYPEFNCSCGSGTNASCPAIGPQGTVLQDSPTRCGQTLRDQNYCVGGQVCNPKGFAPEPGAEQVCGIQPPGH
jgi:hypothetical protein